MSDIAIRVEDLGKRYLIGQREPYKALRDVLSNAVAAPFRRLRRGGEDRPDHIWALRDVSFEVQRGEVVGIIGRNGAGKTTLLKILSRITKPTEGYAEIHGRVGSLLEVGTGFHPELTGRENVYLSGAILGMRRAEIEHKFDEIVDFSGVEKFIDTPVKRYSSGMYVRLAFAVAAHLEPEILLVDEVLAVGDAAFQKKCLGKMGEVAGEGRTVLFVSHNMAAVRKLCPYTMLINSGHITAFDSTDTVISKYLADSKSEISARVTLPPGSPDSPGEGKYLHFYTLEGIPQSQFRLGEPWRVVMGFEISRPVMNVISAIGLVTFDSIPVVTYWSEPKDLTPGHYVVEFDIDIPLKACSIQFSIGISSYERSFYYVEGIGFVSISEVAVDEQPVRAASAGLLTSCQRPEIRPAKADAG